MNEKTCPYCGREFRPSRYHPNQLVCSSKACQRARRTDYHRTKVQEDPAYREQCLDSQRKWLEKNPKYMKRYLAKRRANKLSESDKAQFVSQLGRLLDAEKNNFAFDLRAASTSIWLVCPQNELREKNTFAKAQIIAVQGTVYAVLIDPEKRTSL